VPSANGNAAALGDHSFRSVLIAASTTGALANSCAMGGGRVGESPGLDYGRLVGPADDHDGWMLVGFDQLNG
jgi:hypothetical protein